MSRNLKALGLAMAAVLALGAIAASNASASGEQFHSGATHTILDASAVNSQVFTTVAGVVECANVSVSATINAATVSEITATPSYTNCKVVFNGTEEFAADVHFNGCDYLFTSEIPAGKAHAPVHVKCPTGVEIEINLTFLGAEIPCIKVPAQTPTSNGVVYENSAGSPMDVTINATVGGIEYTVQEECGTPEVRNDGTYNGKVTVKGTDTNGNSVDVTWH